MSITLCTLNVKCLAGQQTKKDYKYLNGLNNINLTCASYKNFIVLTKIIIYGEINEKQSAN